MYGSKFSDLIFSSLILFKIQNVSILQNNDGRYVFTINMLTKCTYMQLTHVHISMYVNLEHLSGVTKC